MTIDKITESVREPYNAMGPVDAPNPPPARGKLADVQPGGMVRLGDQAERARFESWATAQGFDPSVRLVLTSHPPQDGGYADNWLQRLWQAWQAALSAQPSPGGQDALDCIGRIEEAIEFRVPHDIYAAVHGELAELKVALAARQPVGEPVAWYYGFSDTGEAGPVTFGGNPGAEAIAWAERHGHTLHYLYAAQPAQAVDLGEMPEGWRLSKKATCYQLSHGNDIVGNLVGPDAEENAVIIARVLDSQAVGNGN